MGKKIREEDGKRMKWTQDRKELGVKRSNSQGKSEDTKKRKKGG